MGNFITRSQVDEDLSLLFTLEAEIKVEEEKPMDISSLPTELLWLVVEKLEYKDYAQLRQTNNDMLNICDSKSFLLNCYFPQIKITENDIWVCKNYDYENYPENIRNPVLWEDLDTTARIETSLAIVESVLSTERASDLLNSFAKNMSTIRKIRFNERVECKPEDLPPLLQSVNCTYLDCQQFLRAEFFNKDIMNIPNLSLMSCNFSDQQLMQWQGERLFARNDAITATTINRLLKQWKSGERDFEAFYLEFDASIGQRDFEVILEGLDANPIWTPALHHQSAIGRLPLAEFAEMQTGDPEHMYSMWRPDDIQEVRVIQLNNARVEVSPYSNELDFLFGFLTQDQQEMVDMCGCLEDDCIHRRFLSKENRVKMYFGSIVHFIRYWMRPLFNGLWSMWRRFMTYNQ